MANDLPGKFIGLILAFILTVIMPFVTVQVENEMMDRRMIINNVTDFIDEVIDSRNITDAMIDELNVSLASYGVTVNYDITRYARSVNSDPITDSNYYVTYMPIEDTTTFNKGDKISVHVYTVGYSSSAALAHKLTGMFIKDLDETVTARVR